MTKKQKHARECELLHELKRDHGYNIYAMLRVKDRSAWSFKLSGGPQDGYDARIVRLAVPADSALGSSVQLTEPKAVLSRRKKTVASHMKKSARRS